MTRRRRLRRRLLWTGVLLGLLLLLATVFLLRAGAWVGRHVSNLAPIRSEATKALVAVASIVQAFSRSRRHDRRSHHLNRTYKLGAYASRS